MHFTMRFPRFERSTPVSMLAVLALAIFAGGCTTQPNSILRLHAKDAIDRREYTAADQKLATALGQDPADWKANYYMGLVRLAQQRPLDARLHLEVAYSLRDQDPETPDILDALADALHQEGANEKLDIMLKAATNRYGQPRDFYRQATFLTKQGDVDGAKAAYLKAVNVSRKDDITPHMKLADFYEGLGDRVSAMVALQQAQQIDPFNRTIAQRIQSLLVEPTPAADATIETIVTP